MTGRLSASPPSIRETAVLRAQACQVCPWRQFWSEEPLIRRISRLSRIQPDSEAANMTPDIEDLRPSILFEIAKAFAKLGSPLNREQLEGMTPADIYAAAEASGAGIELLSTIGRWGDPHDDVDVLRHLRALNLFAGPG